MTDSRSSPDIVERLRTLAHYLPGQRSAFNEAAARIEALEAALRRMEAEARRYAEMYPQSSDGRNTFVMFADWVAAALAPEQDK